TGSLTLAKTVRIGAAVDNVNVDEGGALWIAAHVRGGLAPSSGKRANARSLVLRYNDFAGAETKPVAIYAEDGDGPSPSIAAARLGSTLLVSGLGEKNVLICALPAPAAR
ncbi:MAG TPA: hypothetical protein VNH64_01510, partial [Parvularculaceae bacterium]|nr:hypothetical protein [Parvularculaceae bacterium]